VKKLHTCDTLIDAQRLKAELEAMQKRIERLSQNNQ